MELPNQEGDNAAVRSNYENRLVPMARIDKKFLAKLLGIN